MLANLPAAVAGLWPRETTGDGLQKAEAQARGLCLVGRRATCVVLCSNMLTGRTNDCSRRCPRTPSPRWPASSRCGTRRRSRSNGSRRVDYVTLIDADQKPAGYLFSSADFAPEVRGFGGRLNLAVHIDASGKLVDLLIVRSNETPSYL